MEKENQTASRLQWTSRRQFLARGFWTVAAAGVADIFFLEPGWIDVKRVRIGDDPACRLIHISDIHYRGDDRFIRRVVKRINGIDADFVCFTGDLVEEVCHLDGVLDILGQINKPVFGVPGNHDFWCYAPMDRIDSCFRGTGGGLLLDRNALYDRAIQIVGLTGPESKLAGRMHSQEATRRSMTEANVKVAGRRPHRKFPTARRILLSHFPATANCCGDDQFDLVLAGHSHGGQIRLPLLGALVLPYSCDGYERGLYQTPAGPLYVNPGLGTLRLRMRMLCRPEITVIDI